VVTKLLKQLLHRKPFDPFRIVMRSGERHDITDPDRVAIAKTYVFLFPSRVGWRG